MITRLLALLLGMLAGGAAAASTTETLLAAINTGETRDAVPAPSGPDTELWILAGQSNMEGVGIIKEHPQPDPRIQVFRMNNEWKPAEDPLHLLPESLFPAHRKRANWTPEQQIAILGDILRQPAGSVRRGVGPGLAFARTIVDEVGRPIGLIPTAHGGTALAQWNPDLRSRGTESLYGALLERVRLTRAGGKGGTLRGMLWYQGESDAIEPSLRLSDHGVTETVQQAYERQWLKFIDAVRADLGEPELPVIYVQIGRFARFSRQLAPAWEQVREAQRNTMRQRRNLFMVSASDLSLDDGIHISYEGQQELGRRMGEIALSRIYRKPGHATPIELDSIVTEPPRANDVHKAGFTITVRYKGVNGRLRAPGLPFGFELRSPASEAGREAPDVYRIDFPPDDPSAIQLTADRPDADTGLICAPGMNPCINITDERGMPVPAFGPLPIPPPANGRP